MELIADLKIPSSLYPGGVPVRETWIQTRDGLVVWMPDGSVRTPRITDGPVGAGLTNYYSLILL